MPIQLEPIALVRGGRTEPLDDHWGDVQATIVLDERFPAEALAGLTDFSHLVVVYHFHRVDPAKIETSARRPRGNPSWPLVGIFAQRGKNRPNALGVSTCEIVSASGREITVRGLDAIDGTPVLDLKPYLSGFAPRGDVREPSWAREIMAEYW